MPVVVEAILARRSIRSGYSTRKLARAALERVVNCGLSAPSSKNAQPWRLHIVEQRELLVELADAVQAGRNADSYVPIDPASGQPRRWQSTVAESAEVLRSVPAGIFVENLGEFSGGRHNLAIAPDALRENALVGYGLEMVGIGAAVQSMWLAAQSLGMKAVFMGDVAIAEEHICARLGMRGDLIGVLALGESEAAPEPKRMAHERAVWH